MSLGYPLQYTDGPGYANSGSRVQRITDIRSARRGGHLVVGKIVAEFGHELMSIGPLRYYVRRKGFDKVTVCTRPGRDALYADFATHFEPHDIQCESSMMLGYEMVDGKQVNLPVERPVMLRGDEWYQPRGYIGGRVEWKTYGVMDAKWVGVVVFHARKRKHVVARNWGISKWTALADDLRSRGVAGRIVCVGSPDASQAVPGCEDARSLPLAQQMDVLHSASYAVGPSSGPMHLAQHCNCPVVVWCGGGQSERSETSGRYIKAWNVFGAPSHIEKYASWNPPVGNVVEWVTEFVRKLAEMD